MPILKVSVIFFQDQSHLWILRLRLEIHILLVYVNCVSGMNLQRKYHYIDNSNNYYYLNDSNIGKNDSSF